MLARHPKGLNSEEVAQIKWDFVGTSRNRCRSCCKFVGTVGTIESGCLHIPRLDRSYSSYKIATAPTAVPTIRKGKAGIQHRPPHVGMRVPHRAEATQSHCAQPRRQKTSHRTHLPQPPMKLNFLFASPLPPFVQSWTEERGAKRKMKNSRLQLCMPGERGSVEDIVQK